MVSGDTYTLTQALKGVFVDTHMTDQSSNKSGPSFTELTRMEEFWEVKNPTNRDFFLNSFSI
jgi:3-deoxy-D-manno-octulosonic acid (KDO) 8-phosphate synthase